MDDGTIARGHESRKKRTKTALFAVAALLACVLIPFLFWHETWFGRSLDQVELREYLGDRQSPRKIQHALAQIADQMAQGGRSAGQWYDSVSQLAAHPLAPIRAMAAWVMGQDPQSQLLHETLLKMLDDPNLLVRRNAALSLVRFGDAAGMLELRAMLQPLDVRAPFEGKVFYLAQKGQWVEPGTPLARLTQNGKQEEILAPVSGLVLSREVAEEALVTSGDVLHTLSPNPDHVWEALRALYFVGESEELQLVRSIAEDARFAEKIRQQARLTAQAIQNRLASSDQR